MTHTMFAPVDFAAVGEQVRRERNDLESQLTTLDRLIAELPASSVLDRMSLEDRKQEVLRELDADRLADAAEASRQREAEG